MYHTQYIYTCYISHISRQKLIQPQHMILNYIINLNITNSIYSI